MLSWQDGSKTIELSIAHQQGSPDRNFANKGNSRADSGDFNAIRLLHGRCTRRGISVYTPTWAVMGMVAERMGRGFGIFTNPA